MAYLNSKDDYFSDNSSVFSRLRHILVLARQIPEFEDQNLLDAGIIARKPFLTIDYSIFPRVCLLPESFIRRTLNRYVDSSKPDAVKSIWKVTYNISEFFENKLMKSISNSVSNTDIKPMVKKESKKPKKKSKSTRKSVPLPEISQTSPKNPQTISNYNFIPIDNHIFSRNDQKPIQKRVAEIIILDNTNEMHCFLEKNPQFFPFPSELIEPKLSK